VSLQVRLAADIEFDSDTWGTPEALLALVRECLGEIDLDPCANLARPIGAAFSFTKGDDGLTRAWGDPGCTPMRIFVNPPYSKPNLHLWTKKAAEEHARHGAEIILLLPCDVSTDWWHANVLRANAICYKKGRVKFVGCKSGSPTFASAFVYFGQRATSFAHIFGRIGHVEQKSVRVADWHA